MAVPPPHPAPTPASPAVTGTKADLRTAMRRARDRFVASSPPPIAPLAPLLDRFRAGTVVAGYVALGSEADPALLLSAAHDRGCRLALPHVTRADAPMRFLAWAPGDPFEPGPFGLLQPRADAADMTPDIVLTPLVAFDAALNRLGQGAGYYDRAFAKLPDAARIGVAWAMQQVDRVPFDPWDAPLDAVLTELDWITAS